LAGIGFVKWIEIVFLFQPIEARPVLGLRPLDPAVQVFFALPDALGQGWTVGPAVGTFWFSARKILAALGTCDHYFFLSSTRASFN
jgi:hypothetical protein